MSTESTPAESKHKYAALTPELFEEVLIWYVRHGAQHMKASRHFNLSRRTLTGWYFSGYPKWKLAPIKHLMQSVEVKARALRADLKADQLAKAEAEITAILNDASDPERASSVNDAVLARAQEGAMIAAARRNTLGIQSILGSVLKGALSRAKDLELELSDPTKMSARQVLNYLRDLAKFMNDINAAQKTTMEMERLLMGEPTEIIGTTNMDDKGVHRIMALAAKTHQRLKAEGKLIDTEGTETSKADVSALTPEPVLPVPAVDDPAAGDMEFDFDTDGEDIEEDDADFDASAFE